jgi:predicted RNase H-like HicB family nuclease
MGKIKVIIDWGENYGAASEQVPGCVATHKTLEGVKEAYASAIEFHIEGMKLNNEDIPAILQGEYKLEFEMSVQALLYYFDGIITRATLSRITGINEKQLGHYLTGFRHPRSDKRKAIVDGLHSIGKQFISVV